MTDETRADWRAALDDLLRQAMTDRPFHLVYGRRPHHEYAALTETFVAVVHHDDTADYPEPPPLTTAQQLALSVLLGDDIPLGVLLSACEDAGVFADGLAGEIAEKARAEEREQGAIAAMTLTHDRADELRGSPHRSLYEAVTLDDHAAWLRDRMMERA